MGRAALAFCEQWCYETLGLQLNADECQIRRAYLRRARETHPDKGGTADEFRSVVCASERLLQLCTSLHSEAALLKRSSSTPAPAGKRVSTARSIPRCAEANDLHQRHRDCQNKTRCGRQYSYSDVAPSRVNRESSSVAFGKSRPHSSATVGDFGVPVDCQLRSRFGPNLSCMSRHTASQYGPIDPRLVKPGIRISPVQVHEHIIKTPSPRPVGHNVSSPDRVHSGTPPARRRVPVGSPTCSTPTCANSSPLRSYVFDNTRSSQEFTETATRACHSLESSCGHSHIGHMQTPPRRLNRTLSSPDLHKSCSPV